VVVGVDPLWVAGRATFFDDMLREAGAVNAAASVRSYASLSKEVVLADPPDIIMTDKADRDALLRDSTLRLLPAVRAGRIGDTSGDIFERPGPRLADGLVQIATQIHAMWPARAQAPK
jgi:iron complex transport system substrate-binding protein